MRSLLEYVISRRHKRSSFPDKPDKEKIVQWLDENGFVFLDIRSSSSGKADKMLVDHYENTGEDCYTVGDYNINRPMSHWIRILKGENVFFIRTNLEDYTIAKSDLDSNGWLRKNERISYDEIIDMMNK